ncbi:unnamed protein product [Taenia asiatica]|uniref:G patch domain-containing protein 4 n=1 Tax=Taenia asiatica TaxID=60517 RepID=A0A0R3VXR5_TAEAS|nr:unnamed protein product [Taenia asiatica]
MKEVDRSVARWYEELQQYDFTVQYLKGTRHSNADAVSQTSLSREGKRYSDGLGKNKDGILKPIKASMKFSRRGLGATYQNKQIDELLWSDVYQEAISRVSVGAGVREKYSNAFIWPEVKFVSAEEFRVDACPNCRKKELANIDLQPQGTGDESEDASTLQKRGKRKRKRRGNVGASDASESLVSRVGEGKEDEKEVPVVRKLKCPTNVIGEEGKLSSQLFLHSASSACLLKLGNGRTAHPAARFGIRCGGKLARVAQYL